jgi:hypothetical protein
MGVGGTDIPLQGATITDRGEEGLTKDRLHLVKKVLSGCARQ